MKKANSPFNVVLIMLFLGLILSPLFVKITGAYRDSENFENRKMAQMPEMPDMIAGSVAQFYRDCSLFAIKFPQYVNDNFPFRNLLFEVFREIKMQLFHVSPMPHRLVLGNDDWLLLGDNTGNAIRESKGLTVFTKKELAKCVESICKYDALLSQRGIKFYFTVAPNKLSVYDHLLPITKSPEPTKLEQLKLALSESNVRVIDLKEDFDSLPGIRLFHKKDSHWNQAGAFLGYRSIMKRIQLDFPDVSVLKIDDFIIDTIIDQRGDLSRLLQTKVDVATIKLNPVYKNFVLRLRNKLPIPQNYDMETRYYEQRFICVGKPLKVLVFGDSFMIEMMSFMARSFGETVILDSKISWDLVDIEKPDIVINETVERDLDIFIDLQ